MTDSANMFTEADYIAIAGGYYKLPKMIHVASLDLLDIGDCTIDFLIDTLTAFRVANAACEITCEIEDSFYSDEQARAVVSASRPETQAEVEKRILGYTNRLSQIHLAKVRQFECLKQELGLI